MGHSSGHEAQPNYIMGIKHFPPPALSPPPFNLLEKPCIRDVSAEVALSVSHNVFCQTLVWLL